MNLLISSSFESFDRKASAWSMKIRIPLPFENVFAHDTSASMWNELSAAKAVPLTTAYGIAISRASSFAAESLPKACPCHWAHERLRA